MPTTAQCRTNVSDVLADHDNWKPGVAWYMSVAYFRSALRIISCPQKLTQGSDLYVRLAITNRQPHMGDGQRREEVGRQVAVEGRAADKATTEVASNANLEG